MRNITNFLEGRLKLRVNKEKNAADRPWRRKFLISFRISRDGIGIRVRNKSVKKFMDRVRQILSRRGGLSTKQRLEKLSRFVIGWANYLV